LATIQQTLDNFKFPEVAKPAPKPKPVAEAAAPRATAPVQEDFEEDEEKPVELSEEDEKLLAQMQGGPAPQVVVPQQSVDEIFARTSAQLLGKKGKGGTRGPQPNLGDDKKKKAKKKKYRELDFDPEEDDSLVPRVKDEWEEE
jgi:hypothetical protein